MKKNKMILLLFSTIIVLGFVPQASAKDGLYIYNFLNVEIVLNTKETYSCNSNNLKGRVVIPPKTRVTFDVSGHGTKLCFNTIHVSIPTYPKLKSKIKFAMTDGRQAALYSVTFPITRKLGANVNILDYKDVYTDPYYYSLHTYKFFTCHDKAFWYHGYTSEPAGTYKKCDGALYMEMGSTDRTSNVDHPITRIR